MSLSLSLGKTPEKTNSGLPIPIKRVLGKQDTYIVDLTHVLMECITPTELRSNIYNILNEVIDTGIPIEINKGGKHLKIILVKPKNKLANLTEHPDFINGDPEELVEMNWEGEINIDLP